jgi:signal transduction histidine kinase
MNSLTLRIYLSVLAALTLLGLITVWAVDHTLAEQRSKAEALANERWEAVGTLMQQTLPPASASPEEQARALREWTRRLRLPLALNDAQGRALASTPSFDRLQAKLGAAAEVAVKLDDGRTLRLLKLQGGLGNRTVWSWLAPRTGLDDDGGLRRGGLSLVAWLMLLFALVATAAWPVSRALTRRLKTLEAGVQAFGSGQLHARVAVQGRDEVASLATSFNQAAERIEALMQAHQTLLANASHELRSPLARLKMALAMLDGTDGERRGSLQQEVDRNISELDALVEEVLLASRLEAKASLDSPHTVDLTALCAEEAAALGIEVQGPPAQVQVPAQVKGEERLLRRAIRNLLENARRYGQGSASLQVLPLPGRLQVRVEDRGPGVPDADKSRIFEPFYRLPGHAEVSGGVGLGLSLVRQIAQRHSGQVWCEDRPGGGSCFVLELPAMPGPRPP